MIKIDDLIVSHNTLRNKNIRAMVEFVSNGSYWTKEALEDYAKKHNSNRVSPLIEIIQFENGTKLLHDGHHRVVATLLGGRYVLEDDEYHLGESTFERYMHANPEKGWYTPFDPRTHCRLPDFKEFKERAKWMFTASPVKHAFEWLSTRITDYAEPRKITSVHDLTGVLVLSEFGYNYKGVKS